MQNVPAAAAVGEVAQHLCVGLRGACLASAEMHGENAHVAALLDTRRAAAVDALLHGLLNAAASHLGDGVPPSHAAASHLRGTSCPPSAASALRAVMHSRHACCRGANERWHAGSSARN
jgi:hypothetical protein